MHRYTLPAALLFITVAAAPGQAQGWTGFRGSSHDGVSHTGKPPTEWGDETNIRWRTELPGPGSSSPVIANGRIYIACYSGYGKYLDDGGDKSKLVHHLACFSQKNGKLLWNTGVPGPLKKDARQMQLSEHGFASPTPIVSGDRIFTYFGRAGVVAFDTDGKIQWQTDLGYPDPDAPVAANQVVQRGRVLSLKWGFAASPVLHEGLVIVNCSEESNSIRALDQKSGKLIWKHEAAELEGTAITPVVVGKPDKAVLLIVLGGEIWGMNPLNGKFLWRVKTATMGGMSSMPVADGELAYVFGGDDVSYGIRYARSIARTAADSAASTVKAAGDKSTDPRVAWTSKSVAISSPILYKGRLLVVRPDGHGLCIDPKNGEVLLEERLAGRTGSVYASPVLADGRFYVVSRKRGTFVYSADGKFELLSRNQLMEDGTQFNASPALDGDQLYLRSDKYLYCIAKPD